MTTTLRRSPTSVLQASLVCGIIALCLASVVHADCLAQSMPGFTPADFVSSPTPMEDPNACQQYTLESCCTSDFTFKVMTQADPLSQLIFQVIDRNSYIPDDCQAAIDALICVVCNPDQSDYINVHRTFSTFEVCLGFCNNLFDACKNVLVNTDAGFSSIVDTYPDGDSLCYDILGGNQGILRLDVESDSTCWSNIPSCTEDDYYPEYTECYAGHRSLAYLLKPASECQGGYQPPPIQTGLDCSIDCNAGYFLDSSTQLCKQCPPGEFSLGGGVRLSPGDWTAFDDMSLDMETYCYSLEWDGTQIPLDNCGWKLQGDFAVSGNHEDSVDSILAVHVNMVRNGTLAVSYQVVAEYKYDGFYIKVDHVIVFPMVSVQTTFKVITIPLTKGFHTVEFIYHKDISMDMGSDEASINILEITGTAHADTSCTLCPLGTFSPNRGSYYCQPCAVNTFASKLGSKSCEACSEASYSLPGADSCEDSLPCTHADMGIRYGPCSESGYRQRYFYWLQPQICDAATGVALNTSDTVACPPCDAGTYRDSNTHQCEYCPVGTARSSDEPTCHTCIPGNEGVTTVEFDDFYEFSNGLNTSCVGSCATSGWYLREDHVESGYDKGILQLKQTLTRTGTLTFVFSLYCSDNCALFFNDNNGTSLAFFGGPNAWYQPVDDRISVSINAGPQTLEWNFANIGDSNSNKAVISFISLTRVSVGGATSCTPCEAGTYSPDGSPCKLVPAGFYSDVGATEPISCSDTSYTDEIGQSECIECGPGTFSNEDHTACLETCSFQPDPVNFPYLAYDLSALKKDDMIGPIYDYAHEDEQIYYLNMCSKQHRNHSCLDGDGAPIPSYSCQITNHGYGVNLGDLIGFIADDEDIRSGLTVQFSHGDMCGADISSGHFSPFPRTTTVEMICDPSAGIGAPVAPVTGVEYDRCAYNFEWRSLYACPICSPDDFSFLISDCGDDNTRTKIFFWKDNPKRCHDGSALPAPIKVPCLEISTYCPPGTWLNTNLDTCIDAEPGYYSIGGGIVYDDWATVPNVFSAQGWVGYDEFITTDNSGKHNLLLSASYVVSGTIDFEYKVYALDDATASLDLYIDDIKVTSLGSTGFEYKTISVSVPDQGQHFFKWIYGTSTDLTKNPGTSYANIRSIKLVGTQLAALYQTICPAGTYSDSPASTGCTPCTTNTFSNAGYTECKPCDVSQYSFNKAEECIDRLECTVDDFEPIYTDCFGGVIFSQLEPIDPQICFGEYPGYYDYDSTTCFDCSPGQYRSGDDCLTCEIGSYYNSDSQTCVPASKGFAAIPVLAFFTHPETALPANFSVGCYGDCHSEGWRFRGENIDSGSHGTGEVDSFITLTTNFLGEGELSFLYYVDGDGMSGLQLYRDGQPIDIEYHPDPLKRGSDGVFTYVSVPMETGDADITWNFHKEPEAEGYAIIKSIILSGVDNGGATEQVSCSPGYFSDTKGSSRCSVCPAGTYSSATGSSSCITCPDGYFSENVGSPQCTACGHFTTSNKDHTDCLTSCTYTNDERVYDLNPLSSSTGPFALADGALIVDICEKQSSPGICLDRTTGEPIDTYACQVFSRGVGVDTGRVLDVEFVPIEDKTPNIVLSFTGGESDEDCDEHTTEITLICDPNVAATSIPTEGATDDCTIRMNWYTPYACPLCQDSDYANRTSECTNNKQTIALAKLATSACYGPTIKTTYSVDCSNGFKLPLIVFLFIAIAFVILFIVIVVIILRNRTLEQKYSILVAESSRNIEMDVSAQQI